MNKLIIAITAIVIFLAGLMLIANPKPQEAPVDENDMGNMDDQKNMEDGNMSDENYEENNGSMENGSNMEESVEVTPADSPANATYIVEGEPVTLTDGSSEQAIPNSSSKVETSTWDTTVGDLNTDGLIDAGLVLIQMPGGSGTFYYAAASVNTTEGYLGTNAVLLGDRVSMQSIEITDGIYVVNYVDRPEGASMSEEPSEAVTKRFELDGNMLKEIVN